MLVTERLLRLIFPPAPLVDLRYTHRFGQINKVYGREMYTALVGAPGQAKVYVFEYNATTGAWDEAQVSGGQWTIETPPSILAAESLESHMFFWALSSLKVDGLSLIFRTIELLLRMLSVGLYLSIAVIVTESILKELKTTL